MVLPTVAGFDAEMLMDGFTYDEARATRAAEFFPDVLRHVKNSRYTKANAPFELQPWQDAFIRLLFGVVDREGLRRFRTVYMEVPRKNGVAALGLTAWGGNLDNDPCRWCGCFGALR